jgi:hypothetical protein
MDALPLNPALAATEVLESQITELAAHIHAATYPHWEGEIMDYGMALDGLLAADGVLVKNYAAWEAEI